MHKFATVYQAAMRKLAARGNTLTGNFFSRPSNITPAQQNTSDAKRRAMFERGAAAQKARSFRRQQPQQPMQGRVGAAQTTMRTPATAQTPPKPQPSLPTSQADQEKGMANGVNNFIVQGQGQNDAGGSPATSYSVLSTGAMNTTPVTSPLKTTRNAVGNETYHALGTGTGGSTAQQTGTQLVQQAARPNLGNLTYAGTGENLPSMFQPNPLPKDQTWRYKNSAGSINGVRLADMDWNKFNQFGVVVAKPTPMGQVQQNAQADQLEDDEAQSYNTLSRLNNVENDHYWDRFDTV